MVKEEITVENKETVTISKEEYEQLLSDSHFLSCLEACGVDNWHGYSDAREMEIEEEYEEESR
jgi:hypothetical protein